MLEHDNLLGTAVTDTPAIKVVAGRVQHGDSRAIVSSDLASDFFVWYANNRIVAIHTVTLHQNHPVQPTSDGLYDD